MSLIPRKQAIVSRIPAAENATFGLGFLLITCYCWKTSPHLFFLNQPLSSGATEISKHRLSTIGTASDTNIYFSAISSKCRISFNDDYAEWKRTLNVLDLVPLLNLIYNFKVIFIWWNPYFAPGERQRCESKHNPGELVICWLFVIHIHNSIQLYRVHKVVWSVALYIKNAITSRLSLIYLCFVISKRRNASFFFS